MYKPAMDEDNDRWIEQNDKAIEEFYDWLKTYKWSN